MPEIKDWKVVVGFDDKLVRDGFKKLEKSFDNLKGASGGLKGASGNTKASAKPKEKDPLTAALQLARVKNKLTNTLTRAKKNSIVLTKYEAALASNNMKNMVKAEVELAGVVAKKLNNEAVTKVATKKKVDEKSAKLEIEKNQRVADAKAKTVKREAETRKKNLAAVANAKRREGEQASKAQQRQHEQDKKHRDRVAKADARIQKQEIKNEIRRREAQKNFMFNLRKQSRILQRQAKALQGVKGSEGALTSIRNQRTNLTALRAGAQGSGYTLAGMGDLNRSLRRISENSQLAGARVRELTGRLTFQQRVSRGLSHSISNLATSYVSAFAVISAALGTYRIGEELEQIQSSLLAVSGSPIQATKDWAYIQEQSLRLGSDLTVMARGFQQIGTAGEAMNFSIADIENIFLGAAESAKAFNLSTEDTSGVMRAFVQIMSKGVVSMEEIKSQLGDRMPVAMAIGAKSMGLTVDKFIKKVSDGQVKSKDFIRGFATELRKSVRETGALLASLDSVRTARANLVTTWSIGVFEGFIQASEGMKAFFSSISKMIIENTGGFKVIGEIVGVFFKVLATGLNLVSPLLFLFTRSLEHVRSMFDDAFNTEKASENLGILTQALRNVGIVGLSVLWLIQRASEELTGAVETLTGEKTKGGFSFLNDIFSMWIAGGVLVWLGKLIAKLTGLKAIFRFFKGKGSGVGDIVDGSSGKAKGKSPSKFGKAGKLIKGVGAGGLAAGLILDKTTSAFADEEFSKMFMGLNAENQVSVTDVIAGKIMASMGFGGTTTITNVTNESTITAHIGTLATGEEVADKLDELRVH